MNHTDFQSAAARFPSHQPHVLTNWFTSSWRTRLHHYRLQQQQQHRSSRSPCAFDMVVRPPSFVLSTSPNKAGRVHEKKHRGYYKTAEGIGPVSMIIKDSQRPRLPLPTAIALSTAGINIISWCGAPQHCNPGNDDHAFPLRRGRGFYASREG